MAATTTAKRLLLVDDDADLLATLELALESKYELRTACNGSDAIAELATGSFDAVILDLMMPVMSGEEVILELAGTPHPPIIVVSANHDLDTTCDRLGVRHSVRKPYRIARILEVIEQVFGSARAASAGSASSAPDDAGGTHPTV